tara:strand:+ start:2385 stop:2663 length:279 start_codon:yes stop_codon:yes gene_type:complete
MTKAFSAMNQRIVRDLSKKLNMEVGMSTSMAVEEAMTYLTMSFHKRNVDSIKAAELLRWWLSDFQDTELEYFETRVDLAKQVRLVDTREEQA